MPESIYKENKLGLWTSASLVVGNMIGAGVFLMPAALAAFGGISLLGWILSTIGAIALGRAGAANLRRQSSDTRPIQNYLRSPDPMSRRPLNDARIVDSWRKNASPWTAAVRENQIASRTLVTNKAIVDAVPSNTTASSATMLAPIERFDTGLCWPRMGIGYSFRFAVCDLFHTIRCHEGTAKKNFAAIGLVAWFSRPYGTEFHSPAFPALKRCASIRRPFGTRLVPEGPLTVARHFSGGCP